MKVDQFDFELPEDRIALYPAEPRDAARLLVVGADGALADRRCHADRELVGCDSIGAAEAPLSLAARW